MMCSIDISDCASVAEATKKAKISYPVKKERLVTESGIDSGFFATMTDSKVFGVVSPSYQITQNEDVFTIADDLKSQCESLKFDSGGILNSGARSFLALQFPNKEILGDEYGSQLIIINSFDGKSGIKIAYLPQRICCSNKINMAFKNANERWSVKHSTRADERLMEAVASIKNADFFWELMKDEFEVMAVKKVNFGKFMDVFMPAPKNSSDRVIHNYEMTRTSIQQIYARKDDLQNFNGTAYKAYQTIADYVSNGESLRKTNEAEERRFTSFLDGNSMLLKAQELLAA